MCELGTLQPVGLREIWPNEAKNFTPWLAKEENLARLSKTLNMELELEEQEVNVGGFRADLLCRNIEDDSLVVIENQLARTNHIHLGQILTYAFELNADTAVWIAKEFRREHRKVFNRLNQITEDGFQLFGLEIQLWKIGNSLPAPQFNIVSGPNISDDLSEDRTRTQQLQLRFWEGFVEYLGNQESPIQPPAPPSGAAMPIATGKAFFTLFPTRTTRQLRVELRMGGEDATAHFHLLKEQQAEIESELGELEWDEKPDKKASSIEVSKNDTDLTDEADWPNQYVWLKCKLEKFREVFGPIIQDLNAADWDPEDEDDN